MNAATRITLPMARAQDETVVSVFLARARQEPARTAFFHRRNGAWQPVTWRDYLSNVERAFFALRALGLAHGDRLAIHAANRAEWLYADLAAEALGAIVVGAYPTCSPADLRQLLEDSGARLLVSDNDDVAAAALADASACPALQAIIQLDRPPTAHPAARASHDWRVLVENGAHGHASEPHAFEAAAAAVRPEDASCIIYTSGTTGPPKGAVLTHRSAVAGAVSMADALGMDARDVTIAYLPLCHLAERNLTLYVAPITGHTFYFATSAKTIQDDIRELQPTFIGAVPRILQKMRAGIEAESGTWFRLWRGIGSGVLRRRIANRYRLSPIDRLLFGLGELLCYRRIRKSLGLGRVRHCIAGTAPVPPDILEFFHSIGVPFRQSYGQTEAGGATHMSRLAALRFDAIGPTCPGYECRIDPENSEVLIRGEPVFAGYWNRPDATRETLRDGWLHTGDLGTVSEDGQLRITGRIKDIIITAGGKNISPANIEARLRRHPLIKDAIVVGDGKPYLTALLALDGDGAAASPDSLATVGAWIDRVNAELGRVETIKKFRCLPRDLDIARGELTVTQKVRRQAVVRNFDDLVQEMYR